MKKIINGKIYNTETATEIATAESSCYRGDFGWWEEALYRSPRGNYFIAGEGGPMTHYGRSVGSNGTSGGSGLRLVSEAEALEWLEENNETAAIEAHFATVIEEG